MIPVSVVIIAKNEADIIGRCISKARLITDDVVVIDSGSSDNTIQIARNYGCRVYKDNWNGYAANKNKGIELARYNWILSIDADEIPDDNLISAISKLNLNNIEVVYDIKFKSYFGETQIRFGKWGRDHHVRLFNRTQVRWSQSIVHETLDIPAGFKHQRIAGTMHHYSVNDIRDFNNKSFNYALLCAKKYHHDGKKSSFIKLYLSPLFGFIKNYVFYLGFLDGKPGWQIAALTLKHTRLKYTILQKLECTLLQVQAPSLKIRIDEAALVNY